MGECEIEQVNDYGVNATTKMSPSYDLIIEENGLFKTIEVWAANKEDAVSEWRGKKGEIRGVVFNEKNYKDEPGLNLLWAIGSTIRLLKTSETWWGSTHTTEHYRSQQIRARSFWQIKSISMLQK